MSLNPLLPTKTRSRIRSVIDNLSLLRAFVAVVEARSFSEAARRLNVAPSTVSKHVSMLEDRIRGQLIIRSTKNLSITELGGRFYERCVTILDQVEAAEMEIGDYNAEPQGVLKLAAAPVFAMKHLTSVLCRFMNKYPHVKVETSLETANVDLVAEGFDAAIRVSSSLEPGLIALKLAPNIRVFCAAPDYLKKYGAPTCVVDLQDHNCIVVRGVSQSSRWAVRNTKGELESAQVSGNFSSDNGDIVRQAILGGLGIGHLARFMVQEHLDSGELVEIFSDSRVIASHVFAVYPERRNLPLKTRAFLDHMREEFHVPPAWVA